MKLKLLLLMLLVASATVFAQPYRNLIISEVRMDDHHHSYIELCNMGTEPINLKDFEVGSISPWADPFVPGTSFTMLHDKVLQPGETFLIATVRDWVKKMSFVKPQDFAPLTKEDIWKKADMQLHVYESPSENYPEVPDSVSVGGGALTTWGGSYCFYLRHHFVDPGTMQKDSVVVDAVNGIFTGENGRRPNGDASDVAGMARGTYLAVLVRKFNVTTGSGGTEDWEITRGLDIEDSEWLPIPFLVGHFEPGRKAFWTLKEHGDFRINEQTIKSNTIDIDWTNMTMTAEWGVRNMDSIMNEFDYAPGVGWGYKLAPSKEDSAFTSVRTGDELTLYATGNQLDIFNFKIVALPPTDDDNRVIPKMTYGGPGNWYTQFEVTEDMPGMDTINEVGYQTRVDSLLKYLEKPDQASWEIVFVDGVERPDLVRGDILKVTSAKGTAKEYFINVEDYLPNDNANLSSITWPDMPEDMKGILGWVGDTIPTFSPTKLSYVLKLPVETQGIPALVAKAEDPDADIEVERAKSLAGSTPDRTTKFHVTAEDGIEKQTYAVTLEKEKDLSSAKTFSAEPFISQFVFRANWHQFFIEIVNPGTEPLDLRNYCIVRSGDQDPQNAITVSSGVDDFANRYSRYVPGYIWQDETDWAVQPSILVPDVSVNPIVQPGDVFVLAWAHDNYDNGAPTRMWENFDEIDVNFKNEFNPWGIEFGDDDMANYENVMGGWYNNSWILYKITNDSVLNGLKPLTDPNDATPLDVIGHCNLQVFDQIEGKTYDQNSGLKRRPEIQYGNTTPGGSFGDGTEGTSEWFYTTSGYWDALGFGWPTNNYMNSDGIGSHDFDPITIYYSTVVSGVYIVSEGYSMNETIKGPEPGITIDDFLINIVKLDEGQTLTMKRGETVLTGADILENGDVLEVEAAQPELGQTEKNKSAYTIEVKEGALDNDATLTSTTYEITIDGETAIIAGIAPNTKLIDVYNNVTAPATVAQFNAIFENGEYAPFKMLNFDTVYVDVLATEKILFEVVAQDMVTKITYQLDLESSSSDAYVLSNVFLVDQEASEITMIPDGTSAQSLLNFLIPAPGATVELQNKAGQVRTDGSVYIDDKVVVTSEDGTTTKTYSIKLVNYIRNHRMANLYSELFTINQKSGRISITGTFSLDQFADNVYTSYDASYVIIGADGNEKTSGNIEGGDKAVVTSFDGTVTKTYSIVVKLGFDEVNKGVDQISVYPNPTNGLINISGIEAGQNIRVFNYNGRNITFTTAQSDTEVISLEEYPAGMYLIVVDNGLRVISKSRIIKK